MAGVESRDSFYARLAHREVSGGGASSEERRERLSGVSSSSAFLSCKSCKLTSSCVYAFKQEGCGLRAALYQQALDEMDLKDPLTSLLREIADAMAEYKLEKLANGGRISSKGKELKKLILDNFRFVCDFSQRTRSEDEASILWGGNAGLVEAVEEVKNDSGEEV